MRIFDVIVRPRNPVPPFGCGLTLDAKRMGAETQEELVTMAKETAMYRNGGILKITRTIS